MPTHHPFKPAAPALALTRMAAGALLALPLWTSAAYFKWEMVELPASTGAACGNGTPYRFFINRTPNTSKTILIFEGGGACYDKEACLYRSGFLGAINPNGIPKDYMTNYLPSLPNTAGTKLGVFNSALKGNITPFATRSNASKVQTQSWNIIYAPYCTGDVYTGNRVAIYANADGTAPISYQHKGNVNTEAMVNWLAGNMPRAETLLVAGFSAGAVGATANYPYVRDTLRAGKTALLADSGPLFDVPATATAEEAPSKRLYDTVRAAWGLDGEQGIVQKLVSRYPDLQARLQLDTRNLGVLNIALGEVFPQDRLGFTLTQNDKLFSSFAYDNFFPEIRLGAKITDRDALRVAKWRKEVDRWTGLMQAYPNMGYYLPFGREHVLKSHTTTMLTFNDTDIPEAGAASITTFADNLIDGTGPVLKIKESPVERPKSLGDKFLIWLQDAVFSSLGV